jgi:DNA-binding beta-propeller fold protein YncE
MSLVALVACGCGAASSFSSTCTAGAPSSDALLPAGPQPDGSVLLPDGRRLTPAGTLLTMGGFPLAMRLLPGDRYAVVTDGDYGDERLRVVDTMAAAGSNPVVSDLLYPGGGNAHAPALFYGLALTSDGQTLYVSDGGYDPSTDMDPTKHYNVIEVMSLAGSPPQLTRTDELRLPFGGAASSTARYPAGLALSADGARLFVACQYDGTLSVLDVAKGSPTYGLEIGRSPSLGVAPYDVVLDEAANTAYVSLWGGKYLAPQMFDDGVVSVDITNPTMPAARAILPTGKSPEQLVLAGGKLYAAAADGDAVSAIDPATGTATVAPSAFDASKLYGSAPNALAVDAANDRLYVANAGENAVQAFQLSTLQPLGRVPTAWYPTAVAVRGDGTLLIASAKGMGGGPTDGTSERAAMMQGTLQVLPSPSADDLRNGDVTVHDNLMRPKRNEVQLACKGTPGFPLPPAAGAATPIKHVFYIVRENKTYDALLGDLQGTHGDATLALWGADVTPNLHALAQRFVVLDNFYSMAEQSLQGHEWTTAIMANDYTEKGWLTTFGRYSRPITAFSGSDSMAHLAQPKAPTIFERLDAAGVAYHNYGELENIVGAKTQNDAAYPGFYFALDVLDVDKIAYVIGNVQDPKFALEPFTYVGLPNDHTYGTQPGKQTPRSMIADNDEATGRFVDALSRSKYWESSLVVVLEDDPNDGGDHVEMHRSPALLISPWVKRGYVSSVHYDVPSLWHTISLILGLDPLNQRDGNAPAMYDAFGPKADLTPYTFVPRKIAPETNTVDSPLAKESMAIDFSRPDTAPLGRILWKAARGSDAEPPWGAAKARRAGDRDGDDD